MGSAANFDGNQPPLPDERNRAPPSLWIGPQDDSCELALGMKQDPLGKRGRNDRCWCGSDEKYKNCHGDHRPASTPGAKLPPDPPKGIFISPTTLLAPDALLGGVDGVPLRMPSARPAPLPTMYTNWEDELAKYLQCNEVPLSPETLGELRVEVLRAIIKQRPGDSDPPGRTISSILQLAAETLRTVASLNRRTPRPSIFWNEELGLNQFLGRTLLLADHVAYPDGVFNSLLRNASAADLQREAIRQLEHHELLKSGVALPIPNGVAMAINAESVQNLTRKDLADERLIEWVRSQMIIEGPTAREVLLVRAADDLDMSPEKMWFYSHIEKDSLTQEGRFTTRSLRPYDPPQSLQHPGRVTTGIATTLRDSPELATVP